MPWYCWFCLKPQSADTKQLNYRHCTLNDVPAEVFAYERTLEELYLDSNRIRDLPRQLFHCHGLKVLSLSDNEVRSLPTAVASLINLQKLDVSRNALSSIPDNIKGCKHLTYVDVSVNPLEKLPEGFTQLISLEELYLNDTYLDFLPANFGRLLKLRILELRENNLNTLPKSIGRLTHLQRLDLGQNEFSDLPEVIGSLPNLTELWIDSNRIRCLPTFIGNLKKLIHLEASNNNIRWIAPEIQQCVKLIDLTISSNELREIPDTVGNLKQLVTLKLDDNQLTSIPNSVGKLVNLEELILSQNDLESLNPCIGLLRKIHILNLDDNMLEELPPEIGSCTSLTILSVHSNRLQHVPAELGHLSNLHVLNLSENQLQSLPVSILNLIELTALWLSNNQSTPLTTLQPEIDKETGQTVCTNFMLPQSSQEVHFLDEPQVRHDISLEGQHPPKVKPHITFASDAEIEAPSRLMRAPTPYPKELRAMAKHARAMHHPRRASRESDEDTPLLGGMVSQEPKDILIKEAKVKKPGKSPVEKVPKKKVEALESTNSTDSPHNLQGTESIACLGGNCNKSDEVSPIITVGNTAVREAKCARKKDPAFSTSPSTLILSEVRQRHSVASSSEQSLQQPPPYHIAAAYSKQAIFFRQAEVQSPGPNTVQVGNKLSSVFFDKVIENDKEGLEHSPVSGSDDFRSLTHDKFEGYLFEEGEPQYISKDDRVYSEQLTSLQEIDVPEEVTSGEESPHARFSYIPVGECFYPTDDELRLDLTHLSDYSKDYFDNETSQSATDSVPVSTEIIETSIEEGLPINLDDYHQHTSKEPVNVYESDTQNQVPESVDNIDVTSNREVLLMQKPQTFTQDKPIVSETIIAPTPQRPGSGSPTSLESLGFIPTASGLMPVAVSPSGTGAHGTVPSRKSSSIPMSTARIGHVSPLILPTKHDTKLVPSYWQSPTAQHVTRIPQPGFYSSSCSNYPSPKMSSFNSSSINQPTSIDTPCNLSEAGLNYLNRPKLLPITDSNLNISTEHASKLVGSNVNNESNVITGSSCMKEQSPVTTKIPILTSSRSEISSPKVSRSMLIQQSRIPAPTSLPVPMSTMKLGPSDTQGRNAKTWMFGQHKNATVFPVTIQKNPGLGFSIMGSLKSCTTEKSENGIFVTKVQPSGPASGILLPEDKILEVDGMDFTKIHHDQAVRILKQTANVVNMMISRQQT